MVIKEIHSIEKRIPCQAPRKGWLSSSGDELVTHFEVVPDWYLIFQTAFWYLLPHHPSNPLICSSTVLNLYFNYQWSFPLIHCHFHLSLVLCPLHISVQSSCCFFHQVEYNFNSWNILVCSFDHHHSRSIYLFIYWLIDLFIFAYNWLVSRSI